MRFAYADPPYLGWAVRYYGDHPDAAVFDTVEGHAALIARLVDEYPDGWALSMTSNNLRDLLPYCPEDCRVAAWVKPFHAYKRNVRPAYSWEPVVFHGGRQTATLPEKGGVATTPKDHLAANITLQRGVMGAKPPAFTRWVLDLLGWQRGDTLVDLFPGSGAVTAEVDRIMATPMLWDDPAPILPAETLWGPEGL